jgi:hypothetical protein
MAHGHFDYRTQPFEVGAAEQRDPGPSALVPSAVLSVELHAWVAGPRALARLVSVSTPGLGP